MRQRKTNTVHSHLHIESEKAALGCLTTMLYTETKQNNIASKLQMEKNWENCNKTTIIL